MPYAVLNALNRAGGLDSVVDAESLLHKVIREIPKQGGKLASAVTEGFDPIAPDDDYSDVNWVANIAAPYLIGPPISITDGNFLPTLSSSRFGCILYFGDAFAEDRTHYTFVLKSDRLDLFDLWDSYGFKTLRLDGALAWADEHPIKLRYAWQTIS